MIKITIATCTYNAAQELPATLESVKRQKYREVEHLIVDGASKDDSLDILLRYKSQNDAMENSMDVKIISEPDNGLYEAMNKALCRATGDYILFLNSGDRLHDDETLTRIAEIAEQSDVLPGVIYGNTNIIDQNGTFLRKRRLEPPAELHWTSFKHGMLICHQAFFASTKLTLKCKYNLSYRFSADYDWCIRLMKESEQRGLPMVNSNIVVADYLEGGMTKKNHRKSLIERFKIMSSHYGFLLTLWYHAYFVLRLIFKK